MNEYDEIRNILKRTALMQEKTSREIDKLRESQKESSREIDNLREAQKETDRQIKSVNKSISGIGKNRGDELEYSFLLL